MPFIFKKGDFLGYTVKYSPYMKKELERLLNGNSLEKKRHENVLLRADAASEDPVSICKNKPKYNMGHYRVIDIGGQFRLFCEILEEYKVLHIVWLNSEDTIHDTSGKLTDKCYKKFIKFYENNQVDKFDPKTLESGFSLDKEWGASYIRARLTTEKATSDTNLVLKNDGYNNYSFTSKPTSRPESIESEIKLIQNILLSTKQFTVTIFFKLNLFDFSSDIDLMKSYAEKLIGIGFCQIDSESDFVKLIFNSKKRKS